MRKLASIRKIDKIIEHPNADKLELAHLGGWQVVVQKGIHEEGDYVVYFEIDSFLPVRPEFEFLRKSCYRNVDGLGEGFRIRTIKLRKEISQGLVIPIRELPEFKTTLVVPDQDVSELLGVRKYEPPIPAQLSGIVKGNFPGFLIKTDQERVQNMDLNDISKRVPFIVTEKLDGSSMTVYHRDGDIGVCSRNLDLTESSGNAFWQAYKLYLEEKMSDMIKDLGNFALQGELIGPGIQGNKYALRQLEFHLFDIYDIDKSKYYARIRFDEVIKNHNLNAVPVIYKMFDPTVTKLYGYDYFLTIAEGKSLLNPNAEREGLVFKDYTGNFSFKAISNKFLLGEE